MIARTSLVRTHVAVLYQIILHGSKNAESQVSIPTSYIISSQSNTRTTLQHLKKIHCQIDKTKKSAQSEHKAIANLNAISFCYCVQVL